MSPDLILFLAANPTGTSKLCLAEECAAIERELRFAASCDFEFQSRWAVSIDELMHHLNVLRPTVIHFSGHGGGGHATAGPHARDAVAAAAPDGGAGIYLQDMTGAPQRVTAEALAAMIESAASSARVVVLNACYSDGHAEALCRVVDCVVGMTGPIGDEAALVFAVSFYRALAHQRSIGNAVAQVSATLAAKQLPGQHLPCCRTRAGVDAHRLLLSSRLARDETGWVRRFEAISRLSHAAHDRLESDPLGAAMRARQAIEHIVDYLHERELGAPERDQPLDARFQRVDAKLVLSPLVASHFRSVLAHTGLVIQVAGVASDPAPALLGPCLASLAIAVEWFFHEYLKRPEVTLGWGAVGWAHADQAQPAPELARGSLERRQPDRLPTPDVAPATSDAHATMLSTATLFATGIGELTSIWRPRPTASVLRIEPPEGEASEVLVFRIGDSEKTYFIGRAKQRSDGKPNDFSLPAGWISISRDQGTLTTRDRDVVLMNTSKKDNVFVRSELVARGCTRRLRHGDSVQLGRCVGIFEDGRYYPTAMAAAIDRRTGLLSRTGLIAEIGQALTSRESRSLFVIRCPADVVNPPRGIASADPEGHAVMVAAALHRHDPLSPIARIGVDVAMLLWTDDAVAEIAAVAYQVSGVRNVSGFLKLHGTADQALPRLEACLGALSRIAIAGRELAGPEDLSRYALVPTSLDAFAGHAHPLFDVGGGAVLFVLGDLERLKRMVPQVLPVLELELVEMLGARMRPQDIVSFAGTGLLLFGTPGDVERCAREVAVAWHARGPVTANAFEIDRCLSAHLLAISDLDDLVERTAALVRGEMAALDASGLPVPLALGAIAVDQAPDTIERARALVRLGELSWQLLAFILVASARGVDVQDVICDVTPDTASEPRSWPAPWRSLARAAVPRLEGQPVRMMELVSVAAAADRDGPFREAMDVIAAAAESLTGPIPDRERIEASIPRLEKAVREMFTALGPLRGWTLITIVESEVVDVDGTAQRVEYIDYTGPGARGISQRVTLIGLRGLGRFAYFVRWDEGFAIALEPFVRRARNNELFLAVGLVSEPGEHRYRSVNGTHEIEQTVTAKQLGMLAGRK